MRIAVGHDWSPFWNTQIEMQRMIAHGLSVADALTAATAGGAYALGLDSHVGTITVGKLADLIVIDGDPFDDPTLLGQRHRTWLVLQLDVPVAGSSLERRLGETRTASS